MLTKDLTTSKGYVDKVMLKIYPKKPSLSLGHIGFGIGAKDEAANIEKSYSLKQFLIASLTMLWYFCNKFW